MFILKPGEVEVARSGPKSMIGAVDAINGVGEDAWCDASAALKAAFGLQSGRRKGNAFRKQCEGGERAMCIG